MQLEDTELALAKEENYQLKNEISELKNAFNLNRDVLKIISQESKLSQPRFQMLYQIINRLTSINNQVMIGTAELIHEKNLHKFEKETLKKENILLKERIDETIEQQFESNKVSNGSRATELHVFFNNKFKQYQNEIKVLEEDCTVKDQEISRLKYELEEVLMQTIVPQAKRREQATRELLQSNIKHLEHGNHIAEDELEDEAEGGDGDEDGDDNSENKKSLIPTIEKNFNPDVDSEEPEKGITKSKNKLKHQQSLNISLASLKQHVEQMELYSPSLSSVSRPSPGFHKMNSENSHNSTVEVKPLSKQLLSPLLQTTELLTNKRKYSSNRDVKQSIKISILQRQRIRLRQYISELEYRLEVFVKAFDLQKNIKRVKPQNLKEEHRRCLQSQYEHELTEVRLLKFAINNLTKQENENSDMMFQITSRKPLPKNPKLMNTEKQPARSIWNSVSVRPSCRDACRYEHSSVDKYDRVAMKPKKVIEDIEGQESSQEHHSDNSGD